MTTENDMYGTGWVKCARCGTTQPLASLVDANKGGKGAVWSCIDEVRCAKWGLQNRDERAAFEQAHPLLVVRKQPTEAEQDAAHAAFLDSVAKDCHCRTGVVCGGVQQGAPCDDLGPDYDYDEASCDTCGEIVCCCPMLEDHEEGRDP